MQRFSDEARREGAFVSLRILELIKNPLSGNFDCSHLQDMHAYLFQDCPKRCPGEIRGTTGGWRKIRKLESGAEPYPVDYAHENIARRTSSILQKLGGSKDLTGLSADAFASRMATLYGDLDHAHPFYEGNSRTLRHFTQTLAESVGYELRWSSTNVGPSERDRLYMARDIAVLERTYAGIKPETALISNDSMVRDAARTLPRLRASGHTLEDIISSQLILMSPSVGTQPSSEAPYPKTSLVDRLRRQWKRDAVLSRDNPRSPVEADDPD